MSEELRRLSTAEYCTRTPRTVCLTVISTPLPRLIFSPAPDQAETTSNRTFSKALLHHNFILYLRLPSMDSSDVGALAPTPLRISTHNNNNPYASTASSAASSSSSAASSSSSSVFSIDAPSSQSSVSSSTNSVHVTWDSENLGSYFPADYFVPHHATAATSEDAVIITSRPVAPRVEPGPAPVPLEFRQHPRRTQPLAQQDPRHGCTATVCPRPPPPLVRQSDRKLNFVDGLVGKLIYVACEMISWLLTLLCT